MTGSRIGTDSLGQVEVPATSCGSADPALARCVKTLFGKLKLKSLP